METNLENEPLEIERKFLIAWPDEEWMKDQPGTEVIAIHQIYYDQGDEKKLRIRECNYGTYTKYIFTQKISVTDVTRIERERELSREEFEQLNKKATVNRREISKTRYRIPYEGHVIEVDVFDFWDDRAFLEVELKSEEEQFRLPEAFDVIREVTHDKNYTNYALAKPVL